MSRTDNKRFYYSAISEFGLTPQGLHWNSRYSQEIRFQQILDLLPLDTKSIVDAGCGFGDMYKYMVRKNRASINYIGLDSLDKMVEEASKQTKQKIYKCDILNDELIESEFYICSGALNILKKNEVYDFIKRCYDVSSRGVIFNFLEGQDNSYTYNHSHLNDIKDFGQILGATIIHRNKYYNNDCTVAFYK